MQALLDVVIVLVARLRHTADVMTNEPENPAPATTPQAPTPAQQPMPQRRRSTAPQRHGWRGLGQALLDSLCDAWGLSPLNEYVKRERGYLRAPLRKVLHLVILAIVLSLVGGLAAGLWLRGCGVNKQYAFLNGKLSAQQDEGRRLERQLEANKQEIIKLTIDLNEVKRAKDAEILKVTQERDAAQQRLTSFESLPANVVNLYSNLSNLYENQPTNREQLAALYKRVEAITTNLLEELGKAPAFAFAVNDIVLTNGAYITIPIGTNNSQVLTFAVINYGKSAANSVALTLCIPEELTVVAGLDWIKSGGVTWPPTNGIKLTYIEGGRYTSEHRHILGTNDSVVFQLLTVESTNLNRTYNRLAIRAVAPNSSTFGNTFLLHFTSGVGEPRYGD